MLSGCSIKRPTPEQQTITKIEYVLPPEEYLQPVHQPSIANYPRDGGGLVRAFIDTKKALQKSETDKQAMREYVLLKKAQQQNER